jgi:hypothetical protein
LIAFIVALLYTKHIQSYTPQACITVEDFELIKHLSIDVKINWQILFFIIYLLIMHYNNNPKTIKIMKINLLKSLTIALTASSLIFFGCSKEETKKDAGITTPTVDIPKTNRALIMDITGTWCPPCGAYGIPGFNKAVETAKERALPIALHSGDPLSLASMNVVMNLPRFKSNSVPRIAAGNGLVFDAGVYSDINATGNKIVSSIDTFIANNPVIAGVALTNLKVDVEKGSISVDVNAKFFTAVSGDYNIAVYFYENKVVSSQKLSTGPDNPNQQHNHVVRGTPQGAWGEVLSTGTSDINKVFTKSYSYMIDSSWNPANLAAMAVIWKKNGSDYTYINGNLKEQ